MIFFSPISNQPTIIEMTSNSYEEEISNFFFFLSLNEYFFSKHFFSSEEIRNAMNIFEWGYHSVATSNGEENGNESDIYHQTSQTSLENSLISNPLKW